MEELFRFIMARPAQRTKPDERYRVRASADYAKLLKTAKGESRARVRQVAAKAPLVKSVDDLALGRKLESLNAALPKSASLADLGKLIQNELGAKAGDVVKTPAFATDFERLSDVLVTNAIVGTDGPLSSDDAARLLRTIVVIRRVSEGDKGVEGNGLATAMQATLLYPDDIFPLRDEVAPNGPNPAADPADAEKAADRQRAQLTVRRRQLVSAHEALTRIAPEDVELPEQNPEPEVRQAAVVRPQDVPTAADTRGDAVVVKPQGQAPPLNGSPARGAARSLPVKLRAEAVKTFDPAVQAVFADQKIDLAGARLTTVIDRLSSDIHSVEQQLSLMEPQADMLVKVGQSFLPISFINVLGFTASVPSTHGTVAPAGVGDLLVVKQFLKKYEAREVGHIENILAGEYKERMHRRARTTEETITVEVETKKEEERDTQTTERFELKNEAAQTVKDDVSFKAGIAISGKYGPVVEFKASTDFALNHAKEESTKVATTYSKEVTSRASSKISERRREERILKTIEEFEEKNTHGVDNKGQPKPVIGQYQWVDKIYEAQVFNYGKRLLFDIMLPEPAAFLLQAASRQPAAGTDLVKPLPFTLTSSQIDEWNYVTYVQRYQVSGVQPPPQPYVNVAKALDGEGTEDNGVTKTVEIPIPDGYQAINGTVAVWYNRWDGGQIDAALGRHRNRFADNGTWGRTLDNEVGALPCTMKTWKVSDFTAAVEVYCQRTARLLEDWRVKTHAAILQAYLKLVRDYEEKLAAAQVQAAQQIQGRNPLENEQLVRTEMKKGAISVFTAQHYDLFGAISASSQGFPQPNLPEAALEGRYIRFFEQAFEWEQMMFFFYPYYWGRKANWISRALLQDVDPLFADFIKAGSARVVVSVRPGFEEAIAHFLDTGEVWNGGDLPNITSPLYLSIIEEIRERDDAPGAEIAQGDPWDVRLPTTLVRLSSTPDLPSWHKDANGEWVPA